MNQITPLFTIIVPAYNVEKYIEECLQSFLRQTEQNFKVIIVNDGSTDSTGVIAQRYAANYPDIFQYIEQENQGQGAARNTGLACVDTPYVGFLDSDDWLDCHYIEKVKRELSRQEEMVDIIFTLPWIYDSATHQIQAWYDKTLLEQLFYPYGGDENVPSHIMNVKMERGQELYDLEPNVCRRVFRTEFLKQLRFQFPVGLKWEDVPPHFETIHCAKCCIAVKGTGFFYRINTSGQTTAGNGKTRLDIIPVFSNTIQMATQNGWSVSEMVHIIKMLWSFTSWSIGVTNSEYIEPLLEGLHGLFRSIPKKYFTLYLAACSPHRLREKVMTWVLRSPFYSILRDYRIRQKGAAWAMRFRQIKNAIWRK